MVFTKIIKADSIKAQTVIIQQAAQILKKGGLAIIPTETVYGIAANMLSNRALSRLYEIKHRPKDKPFSILVSSKDRVDNFASAVNIAAYKLIDKFWPGPLTLILKSKDGLKTVGLRMPDNRLVLNIIKNCPFPIVCPSANLCGQPAPVNFEEAIKDFGGVVDLAIDNGPTSLGKESSVVELNNGSLRILRQGALDKEDIEEVAKKKIILFVCTGNSCRSVMAKGLLEKLLKEKGRTDIEVLSAGIAMLSGNRATDQTIELLKKETIDATGHRSQKINPIMLKKSDIILVMEKMQEERVGELAPEVKNRLFLLKEFARIEEGPLDIADPIGKPMSFYEATFYAIKNAIKRVSEVI
jgi:tRNA threonylcarbamoyl adenosine modification protein (Sua5/YciO/YrdC/YwlC family)